MVARGSRAQPAAAPLPFNSARQAQFWYEWKCHGWVYPVYLGMVYSFIMGLLVWRGALAGAFIFRWAFLLLMSLPIILASAVGPNLGRIRPFWVKGSGSITFLATRPVSSGGLVFSKFQMAFLSGLVTWLIVTIGTMFWIAVSGNVDNARSLAGIVFTQFPGWKGFAVTAATLVLLPAITWRQLSDFFAFALTGRRVIVDGCVFGVLILFMVLAGSAAWLYHHPAALARFLAITPYLAAGLALLKPTLAIGAFYAALHFGLMSWRQAEFVLVLWLILSAVAMMLAGLVVPAGAVPISTPVLFIGIAVFMPLARVPLAVLAMEWNRHR